VKIVIVEPISHPDTGATLARGETFDGAEAVRILEDPERARLCAVLDREPVSAPVASPPSQSPAATIVDTVKTVFSAVTGAKE